MKSDILVITPATNYDLITLDDALLELQIPNPTESDKSLIRKHISGISAAVSKYCDRVFKSEKVEETFWQPHNAFGLRHIGWFGHFHNHRHYSNSIFVKRYPITSIDSIYIDDIALGSDSNDLSLRVDRDDGILYRLDNGYLSRWYFDKSIVVTYTGGYETIPEDLQRVVIRWVEMAWFFAGQDSTVRTEQVYNIASVTYATGTTATGTTVSDVPDEIKLLLEPYTRKFSFA